MPSMCFRKRRWFVSSVHLFFHLSGRYCIALYGTCGVTQLHRVQKLINLCARIVSGRKKYDRISDVVRDLQWLRAEELASYHTLCLLKRVMLTGQPHDIAAMLTTADHAYDTRQSHQLRRSRTVSNSGTRRFSFRASDLYNRLLPTYVTHRISISSGAV